MAQAAGERTGPEAAPAAEGPPAARPAAAPARLVDERGAVALGWFDAPVARPNLEAAEIPYCASLLGRVPALGGLERRLRRLRLKHWIYLGFTHEDVYLGLALVDVGYVGNAFAYAYDRASRALFESDFLLPLARGLEVPASTVEGSGRFRSGDSRIEVRGAQGGAWVVEGEISGGAGRTGLRFDLRFWPEGEPLVVSLPFPGGRYTYTHKMVGLPASGLIEVFGRGFALERGRHACNLDFTKAYSPRHTSWNWAMGVGSSREGRRVGWNLVRNAVEEELNENALWVDGALTKVGPVDFRYDAKDRQAPWEMESRDGRVKLRFEPDGERTDRVRLGLVSADFRQPYGRFSGALVDRAGARHEVESAYGVTEEHDATW